MAPPKKNRKNNKPTAPKQANPVPEQKITEQPEPITIEPSQDSIQEMRISEDSQQTLNNDNAALLNAKIADIVFDVKKEEDEPHATVHSLRSANDANLGPKEKSGQHLELSIESKKQGGHSKDELPQGETDLNAKTTEEFNGGVTEFEGATKDLHKKSHEERIEETGVSREAPEVTAFIDFLNNNEAQKREEKIIATEENESFVNIDEVVTVNEKVVTQNEAEDTTFTPVEPTIAVSEVYESKSKNPESEVQEQAVPETEELKKSDLVNYSQTENLDSILPDEPVLAEPTDIAPTENKETEVVANPDQTVADKRNTDLVETVIKEVYESDIHISAVADVNPILSNTNAEEVAPNRHTIDTIEFIENETCINKLSKSKLATVNQESTELHSEAKVKEEFPEVTIERTNTIGHQNLSDVNETMQRKASAHQEVQNENNYLFVATIVTATALSGYLFFKGIKALMR